MKLPDILSAFHTMPTCDRLDLICRLLRVCVPYELRFLGTVILDAAHAQMHTFTTTEAAANRVNYYSGFKASGLTHAVCEKLCCALAVVHAHNPPVAETLFGLLDNPQALQLFEETVDLKVLDDLRLLYVMAVNHPALSFNQRRHLLYVYLQRMDMMYVEKCRLNLARDLGTSVEKSGDSGGATLRREPGKNAVMTYCDVHSVYKRQPDKRYAYMIQVDWSDGTSSCVRRTYGDFFSFHTKLLDQFPEEGGQKHKKGRMIPFLPGKSYPRLLTNRNNRDLAEKRLPELHRYAKELLSLPEKISQCAHVLDFFRPRPEDLKEEYPSVEKITTLYDLLESGKARMRNYTDSLVGKGSLSGSPRVTHSSPLHRPPPDATPPSSSQSRTAHTLPHQSTSSTAQAKEETVLERRFTYPSRRSAFTPVAPPQQPQATPTTGITNSHPLIPNGSSPSAATETTAAAVETVAETTKSSDATSNSPVVSSTPSHLPTSSTHVTSHTSSHTTAGTTSIISSSHPPISTMTTANHSSHPHTSTISTASTYHPSDVAKPTPTYAPSHRHHFTTPTSSKPLPHLTHPHLHYPPITPPLPPGQSGKTTPIGEVSYTIPLSVGPPILPIFNPIMIGYGSPIHSPSPSPLTPGGLRGKSSSNISRTPTEFESLNRWLKSLRLHKYASIFENMTFDELLGMDRAALKAKGMTEGAAKKLVSKIEELKAQHFSGFRDMSYNPHMCRKPSTCSLPAALLAENRVTPVSSVDGLSPTDSTCSLDKVAMIISQTEGGRGDLYFPLNGSASQENPPSLACYDMAILKAVTEAQAVSRGGEETVLKTVSPPHSITSPSPPHSHTLSPPTSATGGDVQSDSSSTAVGSATLTRSSVGVASGGGVATSWADRLDAAEGEESDANTPEWAVLHQARVRGRSHTPSLTPKHSHAPVGKRHSAEPHDGRGQQDYHVIPPRPHPHHTPHRTTSSQTSWLHRPPALQNLPGAGGRGGGGGRHRVPQHPGVVPVGVNGLAYAPPLAAVLQRPVYNMPPGPGGLPGYPPVLANHIRGTPHQPPPVCFNCGKKGHYGTSCPAETMNTNNPDMFHRQLERLAATAQSSSSSHRHS